MNQRPPDQAGIGLIAGYGSFPLEVAHNLRSQGFQIHTVAIHGETFPSIEEFSSSTSWLHVGQLQAMINCFKRHGVRQVVMAGKVKKLHLFRNFRPDFKALHTLAKLPDRRDDTIMNAIADLLAKEGIEVLAQTDFAHEMLATSGHLFGPRPRKEMMRDAEFGFLQAKGVAALDIGQTVVVQNQSVLAVEAIEGTDEAIRRGGKLGSGKAVVVKIAKPNQDLRFDVPAVGPDTLKVMSESGCVMLAVEAGKTLMLQRQDFAQLADRLGITILGLTPPEDPVQ
jgi:hypothetical protein